MKWTPRDITIYTILLIIPLFVFLIWIQNIIGIPATELGITLLSDIIKILIGALIALLSFGNKTNFK